MATTKAATPATRRPAAGSRVLEEPGHTNERRSHLSTSLNHALVSQTRGTQALPTPRISHDRTALLHVHSYSHASARHNT
jgi:hypothetical protein